MLRLTADEAARICGGHVRGRASPATAIVADSREVSPETAFVAVRGGHGFVADAVSRGAPFVIVEREEAVPADTPAVVVADTVAALAALAIDRRSRLGVRAVGITGSVGKTLTKDLLAAALQTSMRVHAAPMSHNTDVSVPLVVLSCPDDADVLVCELGARHRGEIASLAELVRPDIGVVTGIGVTHLGEFGSRDAIAATKAELVAALPGDGTAIVPSDDDYLALLASSTHARMVCVGPGGAVTYGADTVDVSGTRGWVRVSGERIDVTVPLPGRALVRNAAMAVAVATTLGVDVRAAAAGIAAARPSAWRMEVTTVGEMTVVDDAWNANPTSVASALRTVRELAGDRQAWAVLGEMAELGPLAPEAHERIGRLAAALGCTGVVCIGAAAEGIAVGAGPIAERAASAEEAAAVVARHAASDAVVLVKASRVVGLYGAFPAILRDALGRVKS